MSHALSIQRGIKFSIEEWYLYKVTFINSQSHITETMSQAVGYAPVKKNPRIRVSFNAPKEVSLSTITYDNPTIIYTPERNGPGPTSFIANWPISDPTEVCWDVPANWRITGTITKVNTQSAATTHTARFSCNKIHVYQDGDGLRLLVLTDIKEIADPVQRPMTKIKGPAGAKQITANITVPAKPKTKAAEAAEKRAIRAEVVASQSPEDGVSESKAPPDADVGTSDAVDLSES
jgi:hypothetical protein